MSIDRIEEVNKNIDEIEHIKKFNPYHGKDGRFASKNGGGTASAAAGSSGSKYDNKHFNTARRIAEATPARGIAGTLNSKKIKEAKERGGLMGELEGKHYLLSPQKRGSDGITRVNAYIGTKTKSGGLELESYIDGFSDLMDAKQWAQGTILNAQGK